MTDNQSGGGGWIGWVFVGVFAAWIVVGFIPLWIASSNNAGVFGDSFGFVNSLFSGLAFAGVIIAIILQRAELKAQREELRLTREELRLTRTELAGSREAQEATQKTMALTAYLNTVNARMEQLNVSHGIAAEMEAFEKRRWKNSVATMLEMLKRETIPDNWMPDERRDFAYALLRSLEWLQYRLASGDGYMIRSFDTFLGQLRFLEGDYRLYITEPVADSFIFARTEYARLTPPDNQEESEEQREPKLSNSISEVVERLHATIVQYLEEL